MAGRLSLDKVKELIQSESIEELSLDDLTNLFYEEKEISEYLPDSVCQIDPRDGELVVYNSKRARRPLATEKAVSKEKNDVNCPICDGKTTGIVDIAEQSEGFTFINKNLFPIIYPLQEILREYVEDDLYFDPNHDGRISYGYHFLQWSSSLHDKDLHNLSVADSKIVWSRLAALEKKLLHESRELMPKSLDIDSLNNTYGYVSIIKNFGRPAGGSLEHGHQQISYSNIMPRRFYNNLCFYRRHDKPFSKYMLEENPYKLLIKDYGEAVLVVPYFMRRPYDMLLIIKDTTKRHLHELTDSELESIAAGVKESVSTIIELMLRLGKTPAYNITVNNGPGAGIYFEILPFTQLLGGFERLGLWVCQENPISASENIRAIIQELFP